MAWRARSIGPYFKVTERPQTGEVVSDEQLKWLARAAPALVSELAAYKHAESVLRIRAYEQLVKLEPLEDGYSAAHPPPPPPPGPPLSGALADIFKFFEPPREHVFEPLARAQRYARAAGFELTLTENCGLQLAVAAVSDAPPAWSSGPVTDDLGSQKLFGPTENYRCECGKYSRMRDRGVKCEVCGVEVVQARVRAERFGHLELATPLAPTWFGVPWKYVPILPAGLRGGPREELLDKAYVALLARPGIDTLDEVVAQAMRLFYESVAPLAPRTSDFTARATVRVGAAVRAPFGMLRELLLPILYGVCESVGYTTSIRAASRLVLSEDALARELLAMALHDRVVLLAAPRSRHFIATHVELGDEPVLELTPELAAKLATHDGDEIAIHLPISDAGQYQAKHLQPVMSLDEEGWLAELASHPEPISVLLTAAMDREIDPCTSSLAAMVVGGYRYDGPPPPPLELGPPPTSLSARSEQLRSTVDVLELGDDAFDQLDELGTSTLGDVVAQTADELVERGFDQAYLAELEAALAEHGLALAPPVDN